MSVIPPIVLMGVLLTDINRPIRILARFGWLTVIIGARRVAKVKLDWQGTSSCMSIYFGAYEGLFDSNHFLSRRQVCTVMSVTALITPDR